MKKLGLFLLLLCTKPAAAEPQEVFGTYTLLSQATLGRSGALHLQLGFVDPISETFGIRYEYGYARFHDQKNDWHSVLRDGIANDERDSVDLIMHAFTVGAQKDMGHSLLAWTGTSFAVMNGSYNIEGRTTDDLTFDYRAVFGSIESGFGHRWKIGDNTSLGIDWLVFSIYFHRRVTIDDANILQGYKGRFYETKTEIKETLDKVTAIRSLGLRFSLFL